MSVETAITFCGRLSQLEHDAQARSAVSVSFRFPLSQANRRERALGRVGCSQLPPVFRREDVEHQELSSVLQSTFASGG